MLNRLGSLAVIASVVFGASVEAKADEADKQACVGLASGAACIDGDGAPGLCVPDVSEPGVLTCDDSAVGSGGSGAGGSGGSGASGGSGGSGASGGSGGSGASGGSGGSGASGGSGGSSDSAAERQADRAECLDLDEGDSCTESDGDDGYCEVDDSDPNVLECDDDGPSSQGATIGCSAGGSDSFGGGALVLAGLSLSALARRRKPRETRTGAPQR